MTKQTQSMGFFKVVAKEFFLFARVLALLHVCSMSVFMLGWLIDPLCH